ncbi:MAG: hypothetical protein AABX16_01765 [Nanoarchaeota archaeon]
MERIKDVKLAMMVSASKAFDYLKRNPRAEVEEVIDFVMREIYAEDEAKVAGVAAANFVVNYVRKHFLAPQKEVLQKLVNNSDAILSEIEDSVTVN